MQDMLYYILHHFRNKKERTLIHFVYIVER